MAKRREKSRAELLAEQLKDKTSRAKLKNQPTYRFLAVTLAGERDKLKLTMADVARDTKLEATQVSDAEKGKNVRLSTAVILAEFYGQSVEDLFGKSTLTTSSTYEEVAENATSPPTEQMFPEEAEANNEAQRL